MRRRALLGAVLALPAAASAAAELPASKVIECKYGYGEFVDTRGVKLISLYAEAMGEAMGKYMAKEMDGYFSGMDGAGFAIATMHSVEQLAEMDRAARQRLG